VGGATRRARPGRHGQADAARRRGPAEVAGRGGPADTARQTRPGRHGPARDRRPRREASQSDQTGVLFGEVVVDRLGGHGQKTIGDAFFSQSQVQ
jgi:hypothetical protein